MNSPKGIEDLSDEILIEIFSHLSVQDVVHHVCYVSLRWKAISQDVHLWKNLVYAPTEGENDCKIFKVLKMSPKLQTLCLHKRIVSIHVLHTIKEICRDLKFLTFNAFQQFTPAFIKDVVQNCQHIEVLRLPRDIFNLITTSQFLGQLQYLITLDVYGYGCGFVPLILKPLADGCPALKHIDMRFQYYNIDDLVYFLNKKQHQLLSLKVNWRDELGMCVLPFLPVCTSLQTLYLDCECDITIDEELESLESLKSLKTLHLSDLKDTQVNKLAQLFNRRAMSQLLQLKLTFNCIAGDRLADAVVNNCPLLKVLAIRNCLLLTDTTFQNIQFLKELEYLNLKYCKFIYATIIQFLSKCKHLKNLDLSGCKCFIKEYMKKVTDLNPSLEILTLDDCNIKALNIRLISIRLPNLSVLSVRNCDGVDKDALKDLKRVMPQLRVIGGL